MKQETQENRSLGRLRDLSNEVTVFVTTVGAPSFQACLDHLQAQDCTFEIRIIDHVAPMNAAFQVMLDECRTPFYVQVDEDMLLYPQAVRTLHEKLSSAPPHVAMYLADLYDPHLRRCIYGVKIFRHDIARRYPLADNEAFEVEQLSRMENDGYTYIKTARGAQPVDGQTLGAHSLQWTPEAIYLRYMNLTRRTIQYPERMRWFGGYPAEFLRRFVEDPNRENFYALQGVIAGTLLGSGEDGVAKDFRTYGELPGFKELQSLFDRLVSEK